MKTKPCPSCGNQVSPKATICPQCGHPFKSPEEKLKEVVNGVLSLAAVGVVGWVWYSFSTMEPRIPEHLKKTEEAAMGYILTEAGDSRYIAGSKYCDSKVHEERLYILCGLPNEGWGALFWVDPLEDGSYSLFSMNGPAIQMVEKYGLVASTVGLQNGASAGDILPLFGSRPEPDPGPQAPVPVERCQGCAG